MTHSNKHDSQQQTRHTATNTTHSSDSEHGRDTIAQYHDSRHYNLLRQ